MIPADIEDTALAMLKGRESFLVTKNFFVKQGYFKNINSLLNEAGASTQIINALNERYFNS